MNIYFSDNYGWDSRGPYEAYHIESERVRKLKLQSDKHPLVAFHEDSKRRLRMLEDDCSASTSTSVYESRTDIERECPDGLGLAENECQTAAVELGIEYYIYVANDWDGNEVPVPCGCHLWNTNEGHKLNYNTGSQCGTYTSVLELICRKVRRR